MIWKTINEFENYEISNTGLIRKEGVLLSPFDNGGYERIQLINGDKKQKFLIHRLVATHFIPNPENKPQVNHINLKKKDNVYTNLEWVTNQENVNHAIENIPERKEQLVDAMSIIGKKYGKQNGINSSKPVSQYTKCGELIKSYPSAREASRELGISYKVISKCCNGNSKTYRGFIWKFANEEGVSTIERIGN